MLRIGFTCVLAVCVIGATPASYRVSIDLKDADVNNVLRFLADSRQLNMVVADGVKGRITVKLRNVPWRAAFNTVLRLQGLAAEKEGGVFFIDTLDRIIASQRQRASANNIARDSAELVTVMLPLNYARASELAPIVAGLLSDRGSVVVHEPTNTLIVTDIDIDLSRIKQTVR